MAAKRGLWIHALAAVLGGLVLGVGIGRLAVGELLVGSVLAVLGFLVVGWAMLDLRRFRRGTPESELDGGHTIE